MPPFKITDDRLRGMARAGARRLIQSALEAEIEEHLKRYMDMLPNEHRKAVVRNGYMSKRTALTGIGEAEKQWRRNVVWKLLELVQTGCVFKDGGLLVQSVA